MLVIKQLQKSLKDHNEGGTILLFIVLPPKLLIL